AGIASADESCSMTCSFGLGGGGLSGFLGVSRASGLAFSSAALGSGVRSGAFFVSGSGGAFFREKRKYASTATTTTPPMTIGRLSIEGRSLYGDRAWPVNARVAPATLDRYRHIRCTRLAQAHPQKSIMDPPAFPDAGRLGDHPKDASEIDDKTDYSP